MFVTANDVRFDYEVTEISSFVIYSFASFVAPYIHLEVFMTLYKDIPSFSCNYDQVLFQRAWLTNFLKLLAFEKLMILFICWL